ncbi:hypothetical protein [Vibrio parahaemolyticus]|nr:hypothetical protein [Vibrio parahaemolyticus]
MAGLSLKAKNIAPLSVLVVIQLMLLLWLTVIPSMPVCWIF